MTFLRGLVLAIVALLLVSAAAAWYYLFGPNLTPSARLVPADTIVFANIPNAASIAAGYETSQLKKLADAPEMQPLFDEVQHLLGDKNLALLKVLLPDFDGQSFLAVTHFDVSKPDETGFVAAMKPKAGTDHFDEFVTQLNAAYPDLARETKTGHDQLLGVDYQWIEGLHQPGRVCVARYHGWIVTAWGEASLQDWLERMQGKSSTPSLAENTDYQKSLIRVGKDAQALLYCNYGRLIQLFADHMDKTIPGFSAQMQKQIAHLGATAVGTRFENGDIVDRFSVLEPKQAQIDSGLAAEPCPFETLKFTGPDTRLYLGASVNWQQIWKNLQDQLNSRPGGAPALLGILAGAWPQGANLDLQKNIIDALGSEYSMQMEWPADATYPDFSFFLKIDKPDAFKPVIAALIDTVRKQFATTAVITEMNSGGINFATLKTVRPLPISPTITEDGPWLGLFLNAQHAVRSMARDESRGLLHNDDFNRVIGDQRQGAMEIVYFDTPKFLDQTYRTALPYVSLGAMFNPTLAGLLKDHHLPPDLTWLAPMGSWAAVAKSDDDGLTGYSRSGVGNQGIFLATTTIGSLAGLQYMGLLPHPAPPRFTTPIPGNPAVPPVPGAPASPAGAPVTPVPAVPAPAPAPPAAPSSPPPPPTATAPPPASDANPAPPAPPADSTH